MGLIEIIVVIFLSSIVIPLSVYAHELGHYLSIWYFSKVRPKIIETEEGFECEIPTGVSLQKCLIIYFSGIFLGLIVIWLPVSIFPYWILFVYSVAYLTGCQHDIKEIVKIIRTKKTGVEQ
jgi:hypothetical protein